MNKSCNKYNSTDTVWIVENVMIFNRQSFIPASRERGLSYTNMYRDWALSPPPTGHRWRFTRRYVVQMNSTSNLISFTLDPCNFTLNIFQAGLRIYIILNKNSKCMETTTFKTSFGCKKAGNQRWTSAFFFECRRISLLMLLKTFYENIQLWFSACFTHRYLIYTR